MCIYLSRLSREVERERGTVGPPLWSYDTVSTIGPKIFSLSASIARPGIAHGHMGNYELPTTSRIILLLFSFYANFMNFNSLLFFHVYNNMNDFLLKFIIIIISSERVSITRRIPSQNRPERTNTNTPFYSLRQYPGI